VFRAATAVIHHKITSVDSRQDEVMVATTAGVIERFSWATRQFDAAAAIVLNGLPFAGTPTWVTADGVFVVSLQFKTSLKCLAFALSDGTAGVISSSNFNFDKQVGSNSDERQHKICCCLLPTVSPTVLSFVWRLRPNS